MDDSALAAEAIGLAASHLTAVDRAQHTPTGRLYELIRDTLGETQAGAAVLSGFEEQPADPDRQSLAASALAEAAAADQRFAVRLREVVREASGGLRFRLGTAKIALAVLAVLVVVGGTVAVVLSATGDKERDPQDIGRDAGTGGVNETVRATLNAAAARDAARFCAFLSNQQQNDASSAGGCSRLIEDRVFGKLTDEHARKIGAAKVDTIAIRAGNPPQASARLTDLPNGQTETWNLSRERDRWVITTDLIPG